MAAEATAQPIDEDWIVKRVVAGKYDELRRVKAQSDRGSAVAMHWWGTFLEACVFERCDGKGARALWLKAALAGYGPAKATLMFDVRSKRELDDLIAKIGAPVTTEEKMAYAGVLIALSTLSDKDPWGQARTLLNELVKSEPRLGVIFAIGIVEGFTRFPDALRAMVEAGFSRASETLPRHLVLTQQAASYPEQLALAQAGDLVVGVALCETVFVTEGYQALPADLLPICERALMQGYLGIAPVLLRHHHGRGNANAAAFFADLCGRIPVRCAADLADYHYDRSGKSPAWELWDTVFGVSAGMSPAETKKPAALLRQVLSILTRINVAERACLLRRYDAASKKFADDPACPSRRPVAIPAELLSGR